MRFVRATNRWIQAAVIAIIFAVSVGHFPQTLAQFTTVEWLDRTAEILQPRKPLGAALYLLLIISFMYFYIKIKGITDGDSRQ